MGQGGGPGKIVSFPRFPVHPEAAPEQGNDRSPAAKHDLVKIATKRGIFLDF